MLLFAAFHGAAADSYADARAELVTAYQAGDYEAMVLAAEKSLLARPEYPSALFNLALAYALAENGESSLLTLNTLLAKGVDFGADEMDEFAALRELPGWVDYVRGVEAIYQPSGVSEVVLQLDDGHFVPEGIAVDEGGDIYLGSIRKGLLVHGGEEVRVLSDRQGHWSVFGMRFHDDGTLWFASAAVPQLNSVGADAGRTGLFQLDVDSGELLRSAVLPQSGKDQVLGDLVIAGSYIYATDSLTGVRSKRYLVDNGENYISAKSRQPAWAMLIDIDHFKTINDTLGHITGDHVLAEMGATLNTHFPDDMVVRFGGEEFCILVSKMQVEDMLDKAEKLRQVIENLHPADVSITVSIGLASTEDHPDESLTRFIALADKALYFAKQNGRNQVAIYTQEGAQSSPWEHA